MTTTTDQGSLRDSRRSKTKLPVLRKHTKAVQGYRGNLGSQNNRPPQAITYRLPAAASPRATANRSRRPASSTDSHRLNNSDNSPVTVWDGGTHGGTNSDACSFPRVFVDCSDPVGVIAVAASMILGTPRRCASPLSAKVEARLRLESSPLFLFDSRLQNV
jgi:hypothetical protein